VVPTDLGGIAMGHIGLLTIGVLREVEVREGDENLTPDGHLEALVVDHRPCALLRSVGGDDAGRILQGKAQGTRRSLRRQAVQRRLLVLIIGVLVAARGPVIAHGAQRELPIADHLMPQAVHREIAQALAE